jgi:cell division septation protein DedD
MDKQKTQRIIGILVIVAFVIILIPLFFGKTDMSREITNNNILRLPGQPSKTTTLVKADDLDEGQTPEDSAILGSGPIPANHPTDSQSIPNQHGEGPAATLNTTEAGMNSDDSVVNTNNPDQGKANESLAENALPNDSLNTQKNDEQTASDSQDESVIDITSDVANQVNSKTEIPSKTEISNSSEVSSTIESSGHIDSSNQSEISNNTENTVLSNESNVASKIEPSNNTVLSSKSNVASKIEPSNNTVLSSKSNVASKTELSNNIEPPNKSNIASKTGFSNNDVLSSKSNIGSKTEALNNTVHSSESNVANKTEPSSEQPLQNKGRPLSLTDEKSSSSFKQPKHTLSSLKNVSSKTSISSKVKKHKMITAEKKQDSQVKPANITRSELEKLKSIAWVVQMGTFKDKNNARRLADKLRNAGYKAFTKEITSVKGNVSTRVYIGPEFKEASALQLSNKVEKEMKMQGIVITIKPLEI